jgi:hypothetical protein
MTDYTLNAETGHIGLEGQKLIIPEKEKTMDLYTLHIIFKQTNQMARLTFKKLETAVATQRALTDAMSGNPIPATISLSDDYGLTTTARIADVAFSNLSHVNDEHNANADISVLQAHAQVKFQKRVEQDEILKTFQHGQQLRAQLMQGVNGARA